MSVRVRDALIGCVALFTVLALSQSASAITVSPSGSYTATSGTVSLRLDSINSTLTCSRSSFGATLNSNGTGTVPAGSAAFSNCTSALLGPFTVTQTSAWTLVGLLSILAVTRGILAGIFVTIPAGGLRIQNTAGTCRFTVSGTILLGRLVLPPQTLPIITDYLEELRTIIRVDSVTCVPPLITVGLAVTYTAARYSLSRLMTISG